MQYYDVMPRTQLSPSQVAQFAEFAKKSLANAQTNLDSFLSQMPQDQLEAARSQIQ